MKKTPARPEQNSPRAPSPKKEDPILEFNRRALKAKPDDIAESLDNMDDYEQQDAYKEAVNILSEKKEDLLLMGDMLELALERFCVFIVEEADGPVEGRRVLAVADASEPGCWIINEFATPEQKAFVRRAESFKPEFDAVQMGRDVAMLCYALIDKDVEMMFRSFKNTAWRDLAGDAGRLFNDAARGQRAMDDAQTRAAVAKTFASAICEHAATKNALPSKKTVDAMLVKAIASFNLAGGQQPSASPYLLSDGPDAAASLSV